MTFRAADFGAQRHRRRADRTDLQGVPFALLNAPLTAALATTEALDTAAFALSLGLPCGYAEVPLAKRRPKRSTDLQGTPFALLHRPTTVSLATTEAQDAASFAASDNNTASLSTTEAQDTAAFVTALPAELATTEAQDIAAFNAAGSSNAIFRAADFGTRRRHKRIAQDNQGTPFPLLQAGATTASLATTEAQDVAAFSLGFVQPFAQYDWPLPKRKRSREGWEWPGLRFAANQATLATTEAKDVASFAATDKNSAQLSTTEARDTAAFVAADKNQAALAVTEAKDTAAFNASDSNAAALATTEARDIAAFTLTATSRPFVQTDWTLARRRKPREGWEWPGLRFEATTATLATTEAQDAAVFAASDKNSAQLSTTEARDIAAFSASIIARPFVQPDWPHSHKRKRISSDPQGTSFALQHIPNAATLATTEAQDVAEFAASDKNAAALATTEARDVAAFTASDKNLVSLATTEARDTASFNASGSDVASLAATEARDIAAFAASILARPFVQPDWLPKAKRKRAAADQQPASFALLHAPDLASLATTEARDTASITATDKLLATLAATDAKDTASIAAADKNVVSLATTEAKDTAAFSATDKNVASLATTESRDVASFSGTDKNQIALATTEAKDVASINASGNVIASLSTTEARDTASISAADQNKAALAVTEARDVAAFNASDLDKAALATTEAKDTASIHAVADTVAALAATEAHDIAAIAASDKNRAILATTEAQDTASLAASDKNLITLAATEARDVAFLDAGGLVQGALATAEAPDTAAVTVKLDLIAGPRFGSLLPARAFASTLKVTMPQGPDLSPMDVDETITGWIDFARWLAPGITIDSIVSFDVDIYQPTGGGPFVSLVGDPAIGIAPISIGGSGVSGVAVLQQWTGVSAGTIRATATITTTDGQTLIGWTHQTVQMPN